MPLSIETKSFGRLFSLSDRGKSRIVRYDEYEVERHLHNLVFHQKHFCQKKSRDQNMSRINTDLDNTGSKLCKIWRLYDPTPQKKNTKKELCEVHSKNKVNIA